jgi:hypothetical protein
VGILPTQKVYPASGTLAWSERKPTGRPREQPVPLAASVAAAELIETRPEAFRSLSWRTGTKGPLEAGFAAVRGRVADGPVMARGQHLPGDEAWSVAEHRARGERKCYLAHHPADTPLDALAALIKARWVCERMHQPRKDELGPDHFEGRSWRGLHHHALLCPLAFAFLQHLRLGGKASPARPRLDRHPSRACPPSGGRSWRRSPASSCVARTAGSASLIISGSEGGRVVSGRSTVAPATFIAIPAGVNIAVSRLVLMRVLRGGATRSPRPIE